MKYKLSEKEIFSHRPKPFFFLTTDKKEEYGYENVKQSLINLKNCGFGGFILFNKPPKGFTKETYLSEFWFEMVKTFAICAKELSLEMWINDGFDYPPGSVGGKIKDIDSTLNQKRILLKDGKLVVEKVEWGYPAFENERSSELFHTLVHEQYKSHVGEFFGNTIKGFFSDADNRRVVPAVMFDKKHPCNNYFPWADDFEEKFKDKFGYDIMPYMKDIIERKDIKQASDYWTMSGNLYREWFKKNSEWLHENNLLYTGHSSDSSPFLYREAPRSSCFTESRFSSIQNVFDYPGTDQELWALDGGKHMRRETWYTPEVVFGEKLQMEKMTTPTDTSHDTRAKQVGSTAFMYNKKGAMCEMFAASNFDVSPAELMRIASFQIMQGITFVVTHAYHYRFFGRTKFFAPPEFSERGCIGCSIRQLNDELAEITAMMEKGKSICPVALLDPTENVWRNNFDSEKYFKAFSFLNRKPWGYVIIDKDKILNNDYGFKAVVVAGFDIDNETRQKLTDKGIKVADENTIDSLENIICCSVKYSGSGDPFFARKNIDGEEFTFIANIEDNKPIKGIISGYGREKEIILYPGDIRYFSKNFDNIQSENTDIKEYFNIPEEVKVDFADDNILPLEVFKNCSGETVLKTDDDEKISCEFESKKAFTGTELFIPENCFDAITSVVFNDNVLSDYKCGKVYDDDYRIYDLENILCGKNEITFTKSSKINYFDRIFIKGDFNVDVSTDNTKYKKAISFYNLNIFIPKTIKTVLSERNKTLKTNLSWAEQGQPFYSGKVTYNFSFDVKKTGEYTLSLPEVRDVVDLKINGKFIERKIKYPYEFIFNAEKGKCDVSLDVVNSLGNSFEYYREESGILNGAVISVKGSKKN